MRGKIVGILLLAGLALIIIVVVTEMRGTSAARNGCYAISAPEEPTICK